ncbi:MAG TPA: glutaredoxin family protein [Casimicrobiaceae bacterium]|nr:glutaredoxin family protein [Casimicrobiaceae bacterium]
MITQRHRVQLMLLSRAHCHLCDEMEAQLRMMIGATPLTIIDVDAPEHAALEAAYGDAVPVLFANECLPQNELCRWRLDMARVRAVLAEPTDIR